MPWKECSVMVERLRFVARLLDGESMSEVCREFGISRKTGYKIYTRYKDRGLEALTDRSRRPVRYANQLPPQIENQIVTLKQEKPHWGARKIRELLVRRLAGDIRIPAKSTIHAVLHRHGLVKGLPRPRSRAHGTPLSPGLDPNELWCADFKGEFKLGNGEYCYPLTVTDHASRYLLLCEAFDSVRENTAITAFQQLFVERGLPTAIRSDNGVPFVSPNALFASPSCPCGGCAWGSPSHEPEFPHTFPLRTDLLTGLTDGVLARCLAHQNCPKFFNIDGGNEYWNKSSSLNHTDAFGNDLDVESAASNVRLYSIASIEHNTTFDQRPELLNECQQMTNLLYNGPVFRALSVALDRWVTNGIFPPRERSTHA